MNNKPITELATPEEKVKAFNVLCSDAEDGAKESINISERNREFYEGNHYLREHQDGTWGRSLPLKSNKWRPRTTTDDIYESISSLIPILIRSQPQIKVKPEEPNIPVDLRELDESGQLAGKMSDVTTSEAAEIMTEVLENTWRRRSEPILHNNIVLESLISGTSYVTSQIKRTRKGTEVMPKLLQRKQFLGDPNGNKSWDFSDYRYVIVSEQLTTSEIKYYYNLEEEEYAESTNKTTTQDNRSIGLVGRWFSRKSSHKNHEEQKLAEEYGLKYYPVHTLYYSDVLPIVGFGSEYDQQDLDDAPLMQQMIFVNKKVMVKERENPYWHKEFPIVAFTSSPRPFRAEGTADVSILIGTQIAINLAQNIMLGNAMAAGSTRTWAEEGTIAKGNLDNSPGSVSIFNKGALQSNKVKEVQPGQIGVEVMNLRAILKQDMRERIGDSQGLLRGASPTNIRSGRHAQTVLNAVLTRHGHRVTMLDPAWTRMAFQEVSNLQQFVDFDTPYWRSQHDFQESQEMSLALRNLRYDIDVESKENLPHDVESRINLMLTLLGAGLADAEEFYRHTGFQVRPELRDSIRMQSDPQAFKLGIPFQEGALMNLQSENQLAGIAAEAQGVQQLSPGTGVPAEFMQALSGGGANNALPSGEPDYEDIPR